MIAEKKITLNELLEISKSYLESQTTLPNPDFRLEQAEYKKNDKIWEIVVSYLVNDPSIKINIIRPIEILQNHNFRIYKKLKIGDDKIVKGFYIYNDNE